MENDNLKTTSTIGNTVTVSGTVVTLPVLNHNVYGENFYTFKVSIKRLSDNYDIIPVLVSERLINISTLKLDVYLEIEGQMRSYNNYSQEEGKNKLVLMVFARQIDIYDIYNDNSINEVILDGYICKAPVYRMTPFGREISDILVAVNRNYNKSDYIPCIAWGRNAKYSKDLIVGTNIKVSGRIQSRFYQKKTDTNNVLEKVAYELSISKIEIL
ncbi:MAG: single-stranded DNA-binding protein [Lachnospirales bacterium]